MVLDKDAHILPGSNINDHIKYVRKTTRSNISCYDDFWAELLPINPNPFSEAKCRCDKLVPVKSEISKELTADQVKELTMKAEREINEKFDKIFDISFTS